MATHCFEAPGYQTLVGLFVAPHGKDSKTEDYLFGKNLKIALLPLHLTVLIPETVDHLGQQEAEERPFAFLARN